MVEQGFDEHTIGVVAPVACVSRCLKDSGDRAEIAAMGSRMRARGVEA
jgi:hypothetical protein